MKIHLIVAVFGILSFSYGAHSQSLRFYGFGEDDVDRVKVSIDGPETPADLALDFTIEFWMKASGEKFVDKRCNPGPHDSWIDGNIIIDRDIYGRGDYGDFGVSMFSDGLSFGVAVGKNHELTICTDVGVLDGKWHHVAVTRRDSGEMAIYVDGMRSAAGNGPAGNVGYRDGRTTKWPNSDPFLVFGAEKHDAGPEYPSFSGWLDEIRLSSIARYDAPSFDVPIAPFLTDEATLALYHLDDSDGDTVKDSTAGGQSSGIRKYGGRPDPGPEWSDDTPFAAMSHNGVVRFSADHFLVSADVDSVVIGVERVGGIPEEATIQYSVYHDAPSNGNGQLVTTGQLSWPMDDDSAKQIRVNIAEHFGESASGTVFLELADASNSGVIIGTPNVAKLEVLASRRAPSPQADNRSISGTYWALGVFATGLALLLARRVIGGKPPLRHKTEATVNVKSRK